MNRESSSRLERAGELAAQLGSLSPSNPNLRRALHVGIAVIVLLSVGLAAAAALNDFPELEWRFSAGWIAIGALCWLALCLMNAQLWMRLLAALGESVPQLRGTAIWCMSALGRYVPTSLLLPMMRVAMSEREGISKRVCLASIVYEIALAFTAALAIGAYFVIDIPDLRDQPARYVFPVLPIVAVAVLQPRIFHPLANGVLERLGRAPLPLALRGPRVFEFLGLYGVSLALGGFGIFAIAMGIYPLHGEDLPAVIIAFAAATTLSVLAFMFPGGLVAREVALAVALTPVIPAAAAVAVAVVVRIVQLGIELLLAIVSPALAGARSRPKTGAVHPAAQ